MSGRIGSGFGMYSGGDHVDPATITGLGTPNFVARFTAPYVIGDGIIQDNGTTTGIGRAPIATSYMTFAPATIALSSLNIETSLGVDVSASLSGDIWWNGTNLKFNNGASVNFLFSDLLGANNGIATLNGSGVVPNDQLPFNLMEFLGNWDASTNTPTLSNTDIGAQGNTYKVSVAGTVDFGAGNITFDVGDWVVNNGTIWEKVDNTDAVTSVNGNLGAVTTPLADVLAQGFTTGANDISIDVGQNVIYNNGLFATTFGTTTLTGNQSILLPDASGTVALTSDIVTETLAETLAAGNTTGANDIIMSTLTGTRTLLSDNATTTNRNAICFVDGGGSQDIIKIGNPDFLTIPATSGGLIGVGDNVSLQYQITSTSGYYTQLDSSGWFFFTQGGATPAKNIRLDTDVRIAMDSPDASGFQGIITTANLTVDRTYTFQDASGTVAFLSDIAGGSSNIYNTNGALTALRTLDLNGFGLFINDSTKVDESFLSISSSAAQIGKKISEAAGDDNKITFIDNFISISTANAAVFVTIETDSFRIENKTSGLDARIQTSLLTTNRTFEFPDAAGTLALVGDTIAPTSGGTGITTYTTGDILYASAANVLSKLAIGSAGTFLRSNSSTVEWSGVSLPNSAAAGDLIYASSTNNYDNLSVGTNGQVLTLAGGVPTWATPASGITGTGTANFVSKWSAAGVQTDSLIQDDGVSIGFNVAPIAPRFLNVQSTASHTNTIGAFNISTVNGTNWAVIGQTNGTQTGTNYGVRGTALGGATANIGVSGEATGASAVNVGGEFSASGGTLNYSLKLVDGTQGLGKVLTSDANGYASWATPTTGITGTGTANYISKWSAAGVQTDSQIRDDGTTLAINAAPSALTYLLVSSPTTTSTTFRAINNATTSLGHTAIQGVSIGVNTLAVNQGVVGYATNSVIGNVGADFQANGASAINVGGIFDASGGTLNYALKLTDGTEGAGKVLTSDANGYASWQVAGGGVSPVAETYTLANVVADRTFDPTSTDPNEMAQVLGTLITDLKTSGIIL